MTATFVRVLHDSDKKSALLGALATLRDGGKAENVFELDAGALQRLPGSPFAYWCSDDVRSIFKSFRPYEAESRTVKFGLSTTDDFRFVRVWWEVAAVAVDETHGWVPFVKGGRHSRFYSDIPVVVNWKESGAELYANSGIPFGECNPSSAQLRP